MKKIIRKRNHFVNLLIGLILLLLLSGCDLISGTGDSSEPRGEVSVEEALEDINPPEEAPDEVIEPEVITLETTAPEAELVILDYSPYKPVQDETFYEHKYMGEIFIIKDWQTVVPMTNRLTVYGKVPITLHPDQDIRGFEENKLTSPVILTGFGKGWAKILFTGKGDGGSSVCTGEVLAEFSLVGALYPAPHCSLDVDITTRYLEEEIAMTCVYDAGLEIVLPFSGWEDMFTDVKLPIEFRIPDKYETYYRKTIDNVKYDLSYYLYYFDGQPLSSEELAKIFGTPPPQVFDSGCQNVSLEFSQSFLPDEADYVPSAWDIMLTPESLREQP